uniref:ATP-dependent RNA helicase n=1 Tax=Echinococcus granulosus TaxID=6210 RepID=A0A068WHC0_ECHGR|nr:ATP dependent RNA helicase DDX10 [Echinococcus granulosus]
MQPVDGTNKRSRPHLKIWQKIKNSSIVNEQISDLLSRRSNLTDIDDSAVEKFSQLPLSNPTLKGLKAASFIKPTAVQRKSLKHSLSGRDVIVEAKTGSGKTLAFVIPVLEYIYTEKITAFDGPVAVILTPTRELAKQIFAVFHRVGKFHSFTMLDIMGGKTRTGKREEWQRAAKANILIGTPGRFSQHQQENPTLDMSNLHFLVLDEVDRLLDPTFCRELFIIAENLTTNRQCLLFSATLSKIHNQLAPLGLKSPVMISTESKGVGATPAHLIQFYSVVPLGKKLDYLWIFLQSHCKKKVIVFFSTQKQVRFVHDLFLKMRPFFAVLQLRGNMLQSKRFKIYEKFFQTPRGAVLLATNVAERGLDFPEVHWVVQFDCPKQLDDYIHRVGRTARAERVGRAITFLLPSEVKIVELLAKCNVYLRQQQFPESKLQPVVTSRAPALLASQPELAASARAAFTAYLRDYCFIPKATGSTAIAESSNMSSVFQPSSLPIDEFAASLGLPLTPELPKVMLQHQPSRAVNTKLQQKLKLLLTDSKTEVSKDKEQEEGIDSDDDGLLRRKTFSILRPEVKTKVEASGQKILEVISSDEEDSFDEEEKAQEGEDKTVEQVALKNALAKKTTLTRVQLAKRELKKNIRPHSKIEFDEEGNPLMRTVGGVPVSDLVPDTDTATTDHIPPARLDIASERERLRTVVDVEDKARWRAMIREKHRLERKKAKEACKLEKSGTAPRLLDDESADEVGDSGNIESDGEGDSASEEQEEYREDVEYVEESENEEEPASKRSRKK